MSMRKRNPSEIAAVLWLFANENNPFVTAKKPPVPAKNIGSQSREEEKLLL